MYQTVMILLLTAVITIITTVVTVRVTMTGRILSQSAKDRFRAVAKKYGNVVLQVFGLAWSIYWLVFHARQPDPVTRGTVVLLSFWVVLTLASVGNLFKASLDFIQEYRRPTISEKDLAGLHELEKRLDALIKQITNSN